LDLLPLIGAGVAFALAPIAMALFVVMIWKSRHSAFEMTVLRWIGFGLGVAMMVGVLGYSLLEYLGL
jgi:hypothetical protein